MQEKRKEEKRSKKKKEKIAGVPSSSSETRGGGGQGKVNKATDRDVQKNKKNLNSAKSSSEARTHETSPGRKKRKGNVQYDTTLVRTARKR